MEKFIDGFQQRCKVNWMLIKGSVVEFDNIDRFWETGVLGSNIAHRKDRG